MDNQISPAERLKGFDKPTVWASMTSLLKQTNAINLGQGFPSWQPPAFFMENFKKSIETSNHQYCRSYGSVEYVKAITRFHKLNFGKIDPMTQICAVKGETQGIYSAILGLVNSGEEVIIFDPSFDLYRPQVQLAGGRSVGVPLIPRKHQSKEELLKKITTEVVSDQNDEWIIDFDLFQKSLNERTRAIIINNPHNPTGKIFSNDELAKIAEIIQQFPKIVIIEDNVYEGKTFDDMLNKSLPKMVTQKGMKEKVLSIYSASKLFSTTGITSGWQISSKELINSSKIVHQYSIFCQYNITETAVALSLQEICKPGNTFIKDTATKLTKLRNTLIKQLLQSPLDISLWIPKGGYFVLVDISRVPIMEKYFTDEQGNKRTKDYAFAYQLAHQKGVACIPMSPFYGPEHSQYGENYVRFAFCKDQEMLLEAGKRLRK